MDCKDVEHLIARDADAAGLTADERARLDAHLTSCAGCRAALDDQRHVARLLHARVDTPVRPGFAQRVAARLDRQDEPAESILDLANWRAWTAGLAPVAAALVVLAWLGVGAARTPSTTTPAPQVTFEDVTAPSNTPAAVFLQPSASGDALLEGVLTGTLPSAGDPNNVR